MAMSKQFNYSILTFRRSLVRFLNTGWFDDPLLGAICLIFDGEFLPIAMLLCHPGSDLP